MDTITRYTGITLTAQERHLAMKAAEELAKEYRSFQTHIIEHGGTVPPELIADEEALWHVTTKLIEMDAVCGQVAS